MLSPYYYVMSSLPYLDIKSGMVWSVSDFFKNVEIALGQQDFVFLKNLSEFGAARGSFGVIDCFLDFEEKMKYALACIRAEKLGLSRDVYLESSYFSGYFLGILKVICLKEDPFEVELGLDMLKWQFLTDLEVGNEFNFERLVIYFLKLMIVSRRSLFVEKLGERNFADICQKLSIDMNKKF
ncbi:MULTISPECIES: DUF2764 family protein [unclassified Borrelia]|uniref:DUF2764 family protein n=1 Tax=unclassified Borrelia TaxID=2649934 RepID=UPI001E2BCF56|nr:MULTISPECIES: DUF2764 family protein [unclassified Borrelia]UGQ15805.1 DUF2764 family protein [Borrelia sp. RT5S]UGQ16915.1 DUF2764 family protein [Borrelia sp. RT1S]